MSEGAQLVIDHFDEIVKPEGGAVQLLELSGASLRVGYRQGSNEDCPTCVMTTQELADMMRELLRDHAPGVTELSIEALA